MNQTQTVRQFSYALDDVKTGDNKIRIPYLAGVIVVDYYNGASATCYFQIGENPTNLHEVEHHKAYNFDEEKQIYIVNTSAQSGVTLQISVGPVGADINVGARSMGSATATEATASSILEALANKASIVTGQKTVPTGTAEAIGSSLPIPDGVGIVVKALSTNTATVFVGGSGVTTSDGFELSAGDSVTYYVDNLADVYVISGSADQVVCYTVEQAA